MQSVCCSFEQLRRAFLDRKSALESSRLKFFESGSVWGQAATNNAEKINNSSTVSEKENRTKKTLRVRVVSW